MKKGVFILLLFVLLLPVVVNAEVCDNSKIYIDNIEIDDISNSNIEKNDASFKNNEIDLDLSFQEIGDYVVYKVLLKNDSNEDYKVDKNSLNIADDYISYELVDDNVVIKAGTEEEVFIRVQYKNAVPEAAFTNGVYDGSVSIEVELNNKNDSSILTNPLTKSNLFIIISVVCIISLVTYMIITKKKFNANLLVLTFIFILPIGVSAMCSTSITLKSDVEVVGRCKNLFVTEYGSFSEDEDVKTLCVDDVSEGSFEFDDFNLTVYEYGEAIRGIHFDTFSYLFDDDSYIKVYYAGELIRTITKNDLKPDW